MSTTKKTEIVILGGGGAGTPLAYNLSHAPASSNYHITLINNRPFFQYLLAGARVISTTDGNLEDKSLMPYDHVFANGPDGKPNGTFKQGTAEKVELDEKVIKLTSGEEVKYDYLVLTTGSTWEGALNLPVGSREDAQNYIKDWRKKVANATHVCIVGGGAVGIETAGEIKHYYPSTKVTLVHALPLLSNPAYPDKFRKTLSEKLKAVGVEVILDDFVDLPSQLDGKSTIKTKNGVEISADLWIPARGPKPNTSYLPESLLTESSRIPVLPTLQLPNHPTVFAAGDIIEWPEQKQLAKAAPQIEAIQANITTLISGGKKLKDYKGGMEGIFVTVGKDGGRGYMPFLWGITVGDWAVATVKSKDLFVSMYRKKVGLV